MKVYGLSEFSMLATPTFSDNSTEVLVFYNVSARFIQDANVYAYTEDNGFSAVNGTECYNSESTKVPSINSIVSAINEATAVPRDSESGDEFIKCTTGDLFKVSLNGATLTLCSSTEGFTMTSREWDISVEYLTKPVEIKRPQVEGNASRCTTSSIPTSVTAIGQTLLTGKSRRKLKAEIDFSLGKKCSCKSKPRPCVFVHGLGIKNEMARNRERFYYWGDLKGHAPCCSSMTYTYLNTSGTSWINDALQEKVCKRAMAVSESSTNATIADTIVVTHSMGNLMLAGAIANGKCRLSSSSTWVGLAGPMKGSMCSDFIQASCAGKTTAVLENVAEFTGKCPPTTGLKSLPYEGGKYSSTELNAAYKAAQQAYRANVYAVMCGESYNGLTSLYKPIFWMLGKTVPHVSERNDGMVEFDSCAGGFPESKFGNSYRHRFYRAKLNHFDMEFISGDSLLNEAKMPGKWFECLL
ncbi:hypothetical protein V7S43_016920 [Phytophthora oleae]|uniref:GPI inositol-deacylase n=1 Tax=Phytophthora oleae TaxID=2107226 RepID=A0ABD3EUV3_9STRA